MSNFANLKSWEDCAKVVRHLLEAQRRKAFRAERKELLVTGHGLVRWVGTYLPLVGLSSAASGMLNRGRQVADRCGRGIGVVESELRAVGGVVPAARLWVRALQ